MLNSIAFLVILGLTLGGIFSKLRLPSLVGMILAGIILGPHCANMLDGKLLGISEELRKIALVVILLRAGLALNLSELKRVGRPAVLLCFVPACFEIGAVVLLAPPLLGVTTIEAAIIGAVVAAVSPAVVVPRMLSLMERKIGTKQSIPQMIMAGASVDDVFVIVLFTSFCTLATGGEVSAMTLFNIPISIALGALAGFVMGWVATTIFRLLSMRDTVKMLIIISFAMLLVGAEAWLKGRVAMSGLLAVMAMGITILQLYPVLAKRISPKFNKLWVAAEVMLFVLVGATVDISYAMEAGIAVVALILLALVLRMAGVWFSVSGSTLSAKERLFCAIAYTPKATVQAAIGALPLSMGLECGPIVLTVAVVAIIITAPLGALGIDLTHKKLLKNS